jgi:hypothetical protein
VIPIKQFESGLRSEFLRQKAAEYGKMLDDADQDKRNEAIDFFHDLKALDVLCSLLAEPAVRSQLTKEYAVAAIDDIVQPGDAVVAEHLLNALKSPVQITGGLAVAASGWSYRIALIKGIEHVTGLSLPKGQDLDTMEKNLPKIFPVVEKWLAKRKSADAHRRATTGDSVYR